MIVQPNMMVQPGMMMGQTGVNPYGQFPTLPTPERDIDVPRKFREPTTDVMRPLMAPPSTTQSVVRYNIPQFGRVYNPEVITTDPCMPWYTCSCLPDFDDYCRCCRPQVVQIMDADVPVQDVPAVNKVNTTYWAIQTQRGLCHCWRPCDPSLVRTHYADVKVLLRQHNYYDRCTCPKCRSNFTQVSPA